MQQASYSEQYPFISCKCITYGRVEYLEESLESFIKQDYPGKKEMVIVNDYPMQKLEFEHPEVRIFNLDETFQTIGEKENFAVSECKADIIAVWDDDDLAMPNHLTNIAKWFVPGSHLLHWHRGIFMNLPNITSITGLGNSGIVYSREAWERIGRHPLENAGYDGTLVHKIRSLPDIKLVLAEPADEDVSWVYVWGGRGYHMSGMGTDTPDRPNVVQRHSEHVENLRKGGLIPTGRVMLQPHWKQDYQQMLKNYIANVR